MKVKNHTHGRCVIFSRFTILRIFQFTQNSIDRYALPMQLFRLSGRKVCERVKSKGMVWKGKHFHVRFVRGHSRTMPSDCVSGFYVGVVTSTRLDKSAVKRNRMRRRCREALRLVVQDKSQLPCVQLLLLPRSSSLSAAFGELLADAERFVSSLT